LAIDLPQEEDMDVINKDKIVRLKQVIYWPNLVIRRRRRRRRRRRSPPSLETRLTTISTASLPAVPNESNPKRLK
jgi:hypothetical protein